MAILRTAMKISNPLLEHIEPVIAVCTLNRSLYSVLMISREIADKLKLKQIEKRQVKIGNGSTEIYSYVGPVKLDFNGRIGFSGALVHNFDSPFCYIGSITMDDMDLAVLEKPHYHIGIKNNSIPVE